jgi:predicted ABC-type ATPase
VTLDLSQTLNARPILVAIAGPNGAGKSTFYRTQLSHTGLPFVNADIIALEAGLGAYEAAEVAEVVRREHFEGRESFIFETVFSDPVAEKLAFLEEAVTAGYTVVLFFVGVSSPERSIDRVGMRVLEGGHAVPEDKLATRFPRTMENLRLSLLRLPLVLVYDNENLLTPHRFCLAGGMGKIMETAGDLPAWLLPLLPTSSKD